MPVEENKKDNKNKLSKLQALPQSVQDFLLDTKQSEINTEIIEKFELKLDKEDLYFDITDDVIYKELKLEDFPEEVEKKFGFDKEKSKELTLEILGKVFLPLDSYLGNVSEIIKKMGKNPDEFAVQHIALKKISIEELLTKIVRENNIVLEDELLDRRLKNITINRFKDVRDDEETIAVLTRGRKTGGLELTEEIARKIIQSIKAKIGAFEIIETQNLASPSAKAMPPNNLPTNVVQGTKLEESRESEAIVDRHAESRKPGEIPHIVQDDKKNSDIIYGAEEEREITHHKRELEKKKILEKSVNFEKQIEKSIENILKKGKFSFTDENLKQRFLKIVSARLRDVRDKNETLELILRDRSMGGLGIDKKNADKILKLIETEFESLTKLKKQGELKKIEEWKKRKEEEKKNKEESEKKEEEKIFDKKWVKLTGKPAVKSVPEISSKISEKSSEKNIENSLKISMPKKPIILEKKDEPSKVIPSVTDKISEDKPKVEGIKFTSRLVGPIEELKRMTIVDFKRLAENPKDAIEKIKDKIELLEDESFTKKIEGIKAWRESEPSRIYFEILNQSIDEMISIDDVLEQREEKKLINLNKEEFNVLMELNKEFRV